MVRTYIPGFSQMLLNSGLDFRPELTGGGPAYVDILPGAMPEPADFTPFAPPPVDEFQQRIAQAEEQARALAQPSVTPPAMFAPDPGALNMLMRPDLFDGGPAYVDMLPGALPEPMEQPEAQAPAQYVAPAQYEPFSGRPLLERIADMDGVGGPAYMNIMPDAMPEPMEQPEAQTPFVPSIQPSAPMIMQAPGAGLSVGNLGGTAAPSVQPSAPPIMAAPAPEEEYLNPFDAEAYEYNAPSLSQSGRVQEVNMPVAGAKPEYTAGGALVFNTGRGAMGGFAIPIPGATYALIDNKTGKVITSGTGQAGLEQVWQAANDRSADMGKKANWSVVGVDPTSGREFSVAKDTPPASALGVVADVALPVAGALLAPATFGASAALGAAAGSGLSSALQGRSLKDTLLRAAIAGGTTAAIGAAPGMDAVTGSKVGSAVGSTAASKASPLLGEIIVQGTKAAVPAFVGSGAGGALSNLAGMAPGKGADFADRVFEQPSTPAVRVPSPLDTVSGDPITVLANRVPTGGALPIGLAGASALAQPGLAAANDSIAESIRQAQQRAPENEIVVTDTAQPPPASNVVTGALPLFGAGLPAVVPSVVPETIGDPIEVVEQRSVKDKFNAAFPVVPDAGTITVPENEIVVRPQRPAKTTFDTPPVAPILPDLTKTPVDVVGPEKSILDKLKENLGVTDYMRLAALGLGLVGGGGGNRGALATIPGGLFGGSGVFGGRLPAATLPGASTGFAPRTAAELRPKTTQDWYRYGYGPEQSFFSYVPKGEPNTSRAYTGYEQAQADEDKGFAVGGMAGGGASNSYAVKGPGTGRSDEIPALLSDGEYVMDAETVALLGDGSSKAGAKRLDQLRVKIRKDKGRKLAKGEFSVNAKRPEHYLKGGRA